MILLPSLPLGVNHFLQQPPRVVYHSASSSINEVRSRTAACDYCTACFQCPGMKEARGSQKELFNRPVSAVPRKSRSPESRLCSECAKAERQPSAEVQPRSMLSSHAYRCPDHPLMPFAAQVKALTAKARWQTLKQSNSNELLI